MKCLVVLRAAVREGWRCSSCGGDPYYRHYRRAAQVSAQLSQLNLLAATVMPRAQGEDGLMGLSAVSPPPILTKAQPAIKAGWRRRRS
jgi:hypothetical protein